MRKSLPLMMVVNMKYVSEILSLVVTSCQGGFDNASLYSRLYCLVCLVRNKMDKKIHQCLELVYVFSTFLKYWLLVVFYLSYPLI